MINRIGWLKTAIGLLVLGILWVIAVLLMAGVLIVCWGLLQIA